MSIEDDFFKNANFHSYISLELRGGHTSAVNESFNPFEIPNESGGDVFFDDRENAMLTKTRDIDFSLTTGEFTFRSKGDYFIYFKSNQRSNVESGEAGVSLFKNGVLIRKTIQINTGSGFYGAPGELVLHTIVKIKKNDVLHIRIDELNNVLFPRRGGLIFVAIKVNGAYAHAAYDAEGESPSTDSDAGASSDVFTLNGTGVSLYDTDDLTFGGLTMDVITRDVTYTQNSGFFQPSADRFFAMLSTVYLSGDVNTAGTDDIENEITIKNASNSSVITISPRLEIPSGSHNIPIQSTTCYFAEVSGSQSEKVDPFMDDDGGSDRGIRVCRGTSFSMIDFSNNGTNPSKYLSFELDSDSDDDSDFVLFNTASHSNNVQLNNIQQGQGISFTDNGGLFTVSEKGDYFVMANLSFDHAATDAQERALNSGDTGGIISFYKNTNVVPANTSVPSTQGRNAKKPVSLYHSHFSLTGSQQPASQTCLFIAPFDAGDFMSVVLTNIADAKVSEGSTIAMVKLDGIGGSKEMDPEGKHFLMTPNNTDYVNATLDEAYGYYRADRLTSAEADPLVGDDHTISYDIENQKYKLLGTEVVRSQTMVGPANIRGRGIAYNVTSGGKK